MQLVNLTKQYTIANKVNIAETFIRRLVGLLRHKNLPQGECLIIKPCNSVHTFGMRFRIDVIFLDANNEVVHFVKAMPPNKVSPLVKLAKCVIELPEDTLNKLPCDMGDKIIWHEDI